MKDVTRSTLRIVALLRMGLDELNLDMQTGAHPRHAEEEARKLQRNLGYVVRLSHELLEKL